MDIITLLPSPPSKTTPQLEAGDSTRNALLKLADILHTADKLPTTLPSSHTGESRVQNQNNQSQLTGEPKVSKNTTLTNDLISEDTEKKKLSAFEHHRIKNRKFTIPTPGKHT